MNLLGNMEIRNNELYIGSIKTEKLVEEYGTPLYVIDEENVRSKCREYKNNFKSNKFDTIIAYAGKAFSTLYMCNLIKEEGLYLDVVSGGEVYTAKKAGLNMNDLLFHGNNKSYEEIEYAIELGVGVFVVDGFKEIEYINEIAKKKNKMQNIILRVSPGVEAHTHDYILTGNIDSKFGFNIGNGELIEIVEKSKTYPNINILGLHCHIGSQIHEMKPYEKAIEVLLEKMKEIYEKTSKKLTVLNLGGGKGIYYNEDDNPQSIEKFVKELITIVENHIIKIEYSIEKLLIEPGRSIIGESGTTLYEVGSIKYIENIRKYVSVNGGMSDNIRPALYGAKYSAIVANNVISDEKEVITLAGKCCESGDILIKDIELPIVNTGDIIAITSTGAYNYSMSNNYNKNLRPAVVAISNGKSKVVVERQTYEDIIRGEII